VCTLSSVPCRAILYPVYLAPNLVSHLLVIFVVVYCFLFVYLVAFLSFANMPADKDLPLGERLKLAASQSSSSSEPTEVSKWGNMGKG